MSEKFNDVQRVLRWRSNTVPTRLAQVLLVTVIAFVATGDAWAIAWSAAVMLSILVDARLCRADLAAGRTTFSLRVCVVLVAASSIYSSIGLILLRQTGLVGVAEAALVLCAVMLNAAMMSRGARPVSLIINIPSALVLVFLPFLATLVGHRLAIQEIAPLMVGGLAYSIFVAKTADTIGAESRAMQAALGEKEVAMRAAELARDAAEAANRAKSEFLATVSHEIRTPLNGVLGMAQAMARDPLSPVQAERLGVVTQSGELLLVILNDILDLAKIEAGKLELEAAEFELTELAQAVRATFGAIAEAKGVGFTLVVADDAAGVWRGDAVRVRQVLHNLVSNAVKFTLEGEIGVCVERTGAGVRLTVRDTGVGVPADRMASLFDKFVQADSSTTRRFGGTGLGLAICAELCRAMGGEVRAQSVLGAGSTFVAELPLERVAEPAPASRRAAAERPAPAEAADERPLRVLAAEDNPVNQLVLRTILGQVGLEPMVVGDGAAAVEAWECADWDLILMDVQMPVLDGPTAARRIRAREAALGRPRTPIIALTANAMTHQLQAYREAGMDALVAKPINIADLVAAISRAMDPVEAGPQTQLAEAG